MVSIAYCFPPARTHGGLVEHATVILGWEFGTTRRKRRLETTTVHRYIRSGVNAIYAVAGLRFKQIRRYASHCFELSRKIRDSFYTFRIHDTLLYLARDRKKRNGIQRRMAALRCMVCFDMRYTHSDIDNGSQTQIRMPDLSIHSLRSRNQRKHRIT